MTQRSPIRFLILLLVILFSVSPVFSQNNTINFGSFTSGNLDSSNPAVFYTFDGTAGDLVAIEAIALSGALNPRVSLLSASNIGLTDSGDDAFQPGSLDARITYRLPETSTYTILVQAEDQSTGTFVLRLELRDNIGSNPITADTSTVVSLAPDLPIQAFSFDSAQGNTLRVNSDLLGFDYVVELRDASGETISVARGDALDELTFSIRENTGTYEVELSSVNENTSGSINVFFGNASSVAPPQTAETAPSTTTAGTTDTSSSTTDTTTNTSPTTSTDTTTGTTTTTTTSQGSVPTNRCAVTADAGGVIIRQGPSTQFAAISSIAGGDFRYADGTDNVWFRLVGGGWVSSGVVETNGLCGSLPLVSVEVPSTNTEPTATPTPSDAPVGQR